jgi:hypothetical protein
MPEIEILVINYSKSKNFTIEITIYFRPSIIPCKTQRFI